jgi:hypothetical protein
MQQVHSYRRHIDGRVRPVSGYRRPDRPKGKKRIIDKRAVPYMYSVRDENGEWKGYAYRPPKK